MTKSAPPYKSAADETSVRWIRAVLIAVLGALLFSAAYTTTLTMERQETLQRVSRYNATWLASQASTQVVRFQERVAEYGLPGMDVDLDEVKTRLEVLINRVQLLTTGAAGEMIHADPDLSKIVSRLEVAVSQAGALMDDLSRVETRVRVLRIMSPLVSDLARLAATLNQRGGDQVAIYQGELNHLHWIFTSLMMGVVFCAVMLLFFVSWIHKRFVRQLLTAKEAAEAANAAKSRFLANMSHELRTPMNGVLGAVELLKQGHLSSEQRQFADIAHQSGKVMLDLIATILDHSKIEVGQMELVIGPIDIRKLVENATDMQRADAISKGLSLTSDVASDVPIALLGDSNRLRQILINLLGNAVKFTTSGDVAIKVRLQETKGDTAVLYTEVRDSGPGIAPDQTDRIFEAFAQADDSSTRANGGTGLGLAIARQLTEMMGGKIGVISRPGEGATFWFTVTIRRQPGAGGGQPEDQAAIAALSVLIVTADEDERGTLAAHMSAWSNWPVCTNAGERALTLARRARAQGRGFDLVLVADKLPDMSRDDFVASLRRDQTLSGIAIAILGAKTVPGVSLARPVQRKDLYRELSATAARPRVVAQEVPPPPAPKTTGDDTVTTQVPRPVPHIHALLVEDNPINRLVASEYLKRAGCNVDVAFHGREAVDRCRQNDYDIIFMDCQMPEMDGFEATRTIRGEEAGASRRTPIVALTANAMDGDHDQCIGAGMDDFLIKPANQDAIAQALRRWVPPSRRILTEA